MNKLGFGFLRMQMDADQVDLSILNPMVDAFLAAGGKYFDTAYTYLDGKSEQAIRDAVVRRHPRDSFILADKLPGFLCKTHEDCYRFFDEQLQRCEVDYFDVYLLHCITRKRYEIAQSCREFEFLQKMKEEGKVRKIGFSFHDTADLLDEILTDHPEVDYVQLQINYLDWENDAIQSRRCYETAVRHGKSVLVMEPVKGGTLANVPPDVESVLKQVNPNLSPAATALRFAQSLPAVEVVLSGMNTMEQLHENLRDVTPMNEAEFALMQQAADILNRAIAIPCTACAYCVKDCPQNIPIPNYFKLYNEYARDTRQAWKISPIYLSFHDQHGKASDCIGCRTCEDACPQKIPVTEFLVKIKEVFEPKA